MSPTIESPLNTAHQHVQNSEEFEAQGLLIPAAEEHRKAAEAFQMCIEQSNDEQHKRTVRMLFNEQVKVEKELRRKIDKLRTENKDPSLPQKPAYAQPRGIPATQSFDMGTHSPRAVPSPPPYARGRMMDSHATVDESFMVLGGRSDPGDDFAKFWDRMQAMQDMLEQPLAVAFATAPLGEEEKRKKGGRRDASSSSADSTDIDEPISARFARKIGMTRASKSRILGGDTTKSHKDSLDEEFDEDVFADDNDELSESFCLVPGESEASSSTLKKENAALKEKMEAMQQRLAQAERVLQMRKDQDMQLRDSIVMARQQAQRVMGASMMGQQARPGQPPLDFSSLNINVPSVPAPIAPLNPVRDREVPQLLRRVRELEEEVRSVKSENEKQKVMIAKFRERWEKLKESAKRKKDAKAAAESMKSGVSERIDEEPEAEEAETQATS
ncbi:hypothetical protein HWV62_1514 [Athelia sp. TMB]|nr:hypothetical protein HWV62_1514 [Athelia sp. TMB]